MDHNIHKLAACSVALSALVIGCTPTAQSQRPSTLVTAAPKLVAGSERLYADAKAAVQAGKLGEALLLAERAVESSPRDVGHRMLLADLYLKNGRFASAETSFADVVTLDPGNVRGTLSLALAMVAQGKKQLATTELEKLEGQAAPGDLGLAYALAGQHDRALVLLEAAASTAEATGRVRQNLALAYALAGDWQKARVTAAQDTSPAELADRLARWAELASPVGSDMQVASVLGVTPAAADAGQPIRLALATPEASIAAYAQAAPVAEPIQAIPAPSAVVVAAAPRAPVTAAPAVIEPVDLPVQFAAAAEDLVRPSPVVIKASLPVQDVAPSAFRPSRVVGFESAARKRAVSSRFVVQIGAFRNLAQASKAWGQVAGRYGIGADKQPLSTVVNLPGRGTFHRLSVAPFAAANDAARACHSIRARGGACFVRSVAGDAPLQYAMRNARRG